RAGRLRSARGERTCDGRFALVGEAGAREGAQQGQRQGAGAGHCASNHVNSGFRFCQLKARGVCETAAHSRLRYWASLSARRENFSRHAGSVSKWRAAATTISNSGLCASEPQPSLSWIRTTCSRGASPEEKYQPIVPPALQVERQLPAMSSGTNPCCSRERPKSRSITGIRAAPVTSQARHSPPTRLALIHGEAPRTSVAGS